MRLGRAGNDNDDDGDHDNHADMLVNIYFFGGDFEPLVYHLQFFNYFVFQLPCILSTMCCNYYVVELLFF